MFESRKKASRFLSLLLVLCTVAALTACGDEAASAKRQGGVFIDHDDTVAPASFPFWENALKAG